MINTLFLVLSVMHNVLYYMYQDSLCNSYLAIEVGVHAKISRTGYFCVSDNDNDRWKRPVTLPDNTLPLVHVCGGENTIFNEVF